MRTSAFSQLVIAKQVRKSAAKPFDLTIPYIASRQQSLLIHSFLDENFMLSNEEYPVVSRVHYFHLL